MYFFFKSKLLVMWLGYIEMAYGSVNPKCIDGTYKAANISEGKPKVELRVSDKNIYVDDNAFFTCTVRSNPAAEIFWLYEGQFITNEMQRSAYKYSECNTTLNIKYAEGPDTGRYTCMARNSHGETTSETVTLAVQQKAKYETLYKSASIETIPSRLCMNSAEHENITLKCKYNDSQGICIWKRANKSMNAEKISYCDDRMCCLSIHDFSKEDAGLYMCFMYVDVRKAEVLIPKPDENWCNREDDMQQNERNNQGCCTGKALKTRTHIGIWLYGIIALITAMVCY